MHVGVDDRVLMFACEHLQRQAATKQMVHLRTGYCDNNNRVFFSDYLEE